ncbi:MAG: hypothetical protein SGJ19_03050 [Planctomycetia bacterium]|nr:hypothetical protein [Planctomycetia bacterium]
MCEQYTHTLIPYSPTLVPFAGEIQSFMQFVVETGVVPTRAQVQLLTPTDEVRIVTNPFTGRVHELRRKERKVIENCADIERSCESLRDYQIVASGIGVPRTTSLPMTINGPYYLSVTCRVSSTLCSTSHDVSVDATSRGTAPYGTPVDQSSLIGFFANPHTGRCIEVANAGSARFWIEFQFGKFLFPAFDDDSLVIVNPVIVSAAERCFRTSFAQGCFWV